MATYLKVYNPTFPGSGQSPFFLVMYFKASSGVPFPQSTLGIQLMSSYSFKYIFSSSTMETINSIAWFTEKAQLDSQFPISQTKLIGASESYLQSKVKGKSTHGSTTQNITTTKLSISNDFIFN